MLTDLFILRIPFLALLSYIFILICSSINSFIYLFIHLSVHSSVCSSARAIGLDKNTDNIKK